MLRTSTAVITAVFALTLSLSAGASGQDMPALTATEGPHGSEGHGEFDHGPDLNLQAEAEITDHGVANSSVNLTGRSEAHTLDDGSEIFYVFNSGHPITLNMVDAHTHEVLDRHELGDYSSFSSQVIDADNMLYFSVRAPNDGSIFRYDPYEGEVTHLVSGVAGEEMLRSMTILDGVIYGSTFPNAKVFSYDIESGEVHDYGTVEESSTYAWGFEEVDGNLWVGTGTTPRLREVDPQTGEITDIELPSHMTAEDKQYVNDIVRHDDLVFVRSSPAGTQNLAIYDLQADDWCCESIDLMGTWTPNSYDGKFYFIVGSDVRGYDLEAREEFSIGWHESNLAGEQSTSELELVELDHPDYPGVTLMGIRSDGMLWYYSLENQSGELIELGVQGAAATTQSLGIGPDGNVYAGAHLSLGLMSRLHHETGEVEQLDGPQQGDEISTVGDYVVVGTYQDAGFHVGDMAHEWAWGSNPEHLFSVGDSANQERVADLIDADGLAVAGTVPGRSVSGGTLTVFDPSGADDPQIHHDVVSDHTITTLAYQDGLIYGGTSIHGGHGSEPADGPAEVFVWDVAGQERLDSVEVDPAADVIHSLAFDADGRLWGMTDTGIIFEFETDGHQIGETVETGRTHSNEWGWNATMSLSPLNGMVYGNAGSELYSFDPETLEYRSIDGPSGVRHSTVHDDGRVYFTDTTNIYSLDPESMVPDCGETVTGSRDGPVVSGTHAACVEEATIIDAVRGSLD